MEVFADVFTFCNRLNNVLTHVARMACHIADALHAGHIVYAAQKFGKHALFAKILAVGIYVLPKQGKLFVAVCHCLFNFFHYIFNAAAALAPAHIRHYAVSAEIVAAVHNGYPRRKPALAHAVAFKFTVSNYHIIINASAFISQKICKNFLKAVYMRSAY